MKTKTADKLTVLLFDDGPSWFAQGLEIDHFAQDSTKEAVKENFKKSLQWTMDAHIKEFGHLRNLNHKAPKDHWHSESVEKYELSVPHGIYDN